jgi:hypothetical protein
VADPGQEVSLRVLDEFDGKVKLEWKPLRPDPTHFSLTEHSGKLTITTQNGSIHRDSEARQIPLAKNIFLLDNSLPHECGLVVTTCLDPFRPTAPWQQAGLILYDDDDNYLKWVCQSSRQGEPELNLLREVGAQSSITKHPIDDDVPGRVWLRLTTRGNHHEYATSTDGRTFTVHGELPWGSGPPKRIGLVAKNGGRPHAAEIGVKFDF